MEKVVFMKVIVPLICAALAALSLLVAGCAQKAEFRKSGPAFSGRADATITRDEDGRTVIHIKAVRLTDPRRLYSGRSVYVVWLKDMAANVEKLGVLETDYAFNADFTASTPHEQFILFIGAETGPDVPEPGTHVVLKTDIIIAD